jgi:hypothetical protein
MSDPPARTLRRVLVSLAGLAVWAGHFTAIYAATAIACERGAAARSLLGVPLLPAIALVVTLLALAVLGLILRPALRTGAPSLADAAQAEPWFAHWFTIGAAGLAALAVLFQAIPAFVLPGCG